MSAFIREQPENPHAARGELYPPASRLPSSRAYDLECWEGKNHLDPRFERPALPLQEFVSEVPWENQVIIRPHRPRIFLADDRNVCSKRSGAEFIGISIGCSFDDASVKSTPLEYGISLCRSAVDMNSFSLLLQPEDHRLEFLSMPFNPPLEIRVWFIRLELHLN